MRGSSSILHEKIVSADPVFSLLVLNSKLEEPFPTKCGFTPLVSLLK